MNSSQQTSALPMDEIHTVCDDVAHGADIQELVENMRSVMIERKGIGLAANQIGDTRRVIIINTQHCRHVLINPIITKSYCGKCTEQEGCLSFPNEKVFVERYKRIVVEAYDQNWEKVKLKLNGIDARCVQHEVDHLNGIDFTMRSKF